MAENNKVGLLKIVLIIDAVVCLVYGLGYLLFPNSLVDLSGGDPISPGWLRWSGGILCALGIGQILVFMKPEGQGIFVTTMALGCSLAGLAMLWTWISATGDGNLWFTALPCIIVLALACLFWWSRSTAKSILYP